MAEVVILSPGYPNVPGGVTDHTARLVRHFGERNVQPRVLGTLSVHPAEFVARVADGGALALLIQYVPFLYGRRGLSRFPKQVAKLARKRGLRVVTFVHEPWVPPTRLPWLALSPLQRRQLKRLMACSHAVLTPVPAWVELLGGKTQLLYVGSTLGEPPVQSATPDSLDGPVVFSPFAAGFRWEWVAHASRHIGATRELIVIGATQSELRRHEQTGRFWNASWECTGRLPAKRVLEYLGRASVVLAPFVDGITGRRTSALAALGAGARLVSSTGHLADPFFVEGPLDAASSETEFVTIASRLWITPDTEEARRARRRWYDKHLETHRLDATLLAILLDGSQ